MTLWCAWCKDSIQKLGEGKGTVDGICPKCRKTHFPETLRTVQENARELLLDFRRGFSIEESKRRESL